MINQIREKDVLFRFCNHPFAFEKKAIFEWHRAMQLFDECDGSITTSLAWQKYVPTIKNVHDYGCRIAEFMNNNAKSKGKYRDDSRKIYCGAYSFDAKAVRGLIGVDGLQDIDSADVTHLIENNEIAHVCMRVTFKEVRQFVDNEGTKTAILVHLWNNTYGPLPHKCKCDKSIEIHPSVNLIAAPKGLFVDNRGYLEYFWHYFRFRVYKSLYRLLCVISNAKESI